MVTEAQKQVFKEKLDEVFEIAKSEEQEATKEQRKWLSDLYIRFRNYKNNVNPKHILPHDHLITLETKLNEENLTLDEFEKTEGKITLLIETMKTKSSSKEMTLDEMIEFRNKTEEECREIERKLNKKKLYRLTDEQCTEYQQKIEDYKLVIRDINKKIEELTIKEEVTEEKPSDLACKKIEELIAQGKAKDAEITSLKDEIAKYKEERAYFNTKCREEYERQLGIYTKQKDEEVAEKIQDEVRKQISKANQKEEENKVIQKKHITNLLLTQNIVKLDDIRLKLKTVNCSTSKLDIAINEVMAEIPGVIRVLDSDGQIQYYSLCANASNKLDALKKNEVCPKLTNAMTGVVSFVAFADLHIPLNAKEDEIKKTIHPLFEFSASQKNLPIIDLGDDGDTLKDIPYEKWIKQDKEAAEQVYSFLRKFGRVINECPTTKVFYKPGNHEEHAYLVGIDPMETLNSCANNIVFLGPGKSSVMIGNDKLGIFHGLDQVPYGNRRNFLDYSQHICSEISKHLQNIAKDYFYSLIAHYHFAEHRPFQHFSLIGHSNKCPVQFTAILEDGEVKRMYAQNLTLSKKENTYVADPYRIEIYNADYKCKKISH